MTPEQYIKWAVLELTAKWNKKTLPPITSKNIDALYDASVAADLHWDGACSIRCGEFETDIPCEYSRHYESKSVAAKMPDGTWVGWTYWYGGGKHAEPEMIDWMNRAYFVDCKEEEKTVVVRTFNKLETKAA